MLQNMLSNIIILLKKLKCKTSLKFLLEMITNLSILIIGENNSIIMVS